MARRLALVTGGSRGIGRAIALTLGKNGCDVAVNYNASAEAAEALCGELAALGVRASAFGADVSDRFQVEALFKAVEAGMGPVESIVNIASVVGLVGNAGQANYSASKAGLIGFSKSVAREYAARGVTVNVVAPGFIGTDMTGVLKEQVREAILGQIPLGRMGSPEDVARAVAFFASEESSYVTGQVLAVDGGRTMC